MIIAAFILIAIGVLLFIFTPLFATSDTIVQTTQRETKRRQMLEESERVYEALRELDFDKRMGKVEEGDYQDMRNRYQAQAVELMKALDKTNGTASRPKDIPIAKATDASIEKEIAAIRQARNKN
ncbi:MAG: hypothetical protein HN521_15245 [Candidatus Latescibacteria bacterium]|jgi:hypothetical protein|nr:hypothetical protein [Candidatus Latescibacterota bacterium]MBT5828924.1 hypothetical protein [Candidatus Latescibacterota bacterium]